MEKELEKLADQAIENLCRVIEASEGKLLGIGLFTVDSITVVGSYLLFEGDSDSNYDDDMFFNPFEWSRPEEESFNDINSFLETFEDVVETDEEYDKRLEIFFNAFEKAFKKRNLHERYGEDLYITLGGVDPNDALEEAAATFIRKMNSPEIYQRYCKVMEW